MTGAALIALARQSVARAAAALQVCSDGEVARLVCECKPGTPAFTLARRELVVRALILNPSSTPYHLTDLDTCRDAWHRAKATHRPQSILAAISVHGQRRAAEAEETRGSAPATPAEGRARPSALSQVAAQRRDLASAAAHAACAAAQPEGSGESSGRPGRRRHLEARP